MNIQKSTKKKTILYITELFPFPPTSGAKIKSINTIQTLSKKFNIILVCFNKNKVSKKHLSHIKKLVERVEIIILPNLDQPPQEDMKRLLDNYLKLNPYFLYQFYSNKAEVRIDYLIKKFNPEIIHIDHINMAQYLPKNKKQLWVLEEHNIEHQLALTKYRNFPNLKKTKLHLLAEFLLIYFFEKRTYKKFDHIFTISEFDELILRNKFKIKNISTQKLVYSRRKKIPINQKRENNEILFLGDITWMPNKLAVKWFVCKIFPLIKTKIPGAIFNVVGEIESDFSKKIGGNKGVRVHGFQKNINRFLSSASLFVMPFQAGGGVRIKALTAFSNKLPIVSTSLGIQGLDINNNHGFFSANTPKDFGKYCLIALKNSNIRTKIGNIGYRYLKKNHSINNNAHFLSKYQNLL